jgi:probable HAF family extracellular repeat protein
MKPGACLVNLPVLSRFAAAATVGLSGGLCGAQITFHLLPIPAGMSGGSAADGVSADGSVVVGGIGGSDVRWVGQQVEVMPSIGTNASLHAVSGDGSSAIGTNHSMNPSRGFRWGPSGVETLNIMEAYGVNYDGSVVVGDTLVQGSNAPWACRLSGAGVQVIANEGSQANGVSADGNVVAGSYYPNPALTVQRAFRWTTAGLQDLGTLPGYSSSEGRGTSADGSRLFGRCSDTQNSVPYRTFVWTAGQGMMDIGLLPTAVASQPDAMSADGHVIVGQATVPMGGQYGFTPFVWIEGQGVIDFRSLLGGAGFDMSSYASLYFGGLSADGTTIVGYGYRSSSVDAWVVTIPSPASGLFVLLGFAGMSRRRSRT